jgi:hypothetical protein
MELPVRCKNCHRCYTLGKDSIVIGTGQFLSDFRYAAYLGDPSVNSREQPDLIDSFPPEDKRNFYSLTAQQKNEQLAQMNRILVSLSSETPRWWRCRKCDAVQTYNLTVSSKQFEGKTLDEALANASSAIAPRKILDHKIVHDAKEETVTGIGNSSQAAIDSAKQKMPAESFDQSAGEIIQRSQDFTMEINAFSEQEARNIWYRGSPEGAKLNKLSCAIAPKRGFLGRDKQGSWKAEWSTPFIAKMTYKIPAVITVFCFEETL